jgi:uncharacterized protein
VLHWRLCGIPHRQPPPTRFRPLTDPALSPDSYAQLADALAGVEAPVSAAEVHGIISGVVCAHGAADGPWRAHALGDVMAPPELADRLDRLFGRTAALLHEGEIDFGLLLPGDDAALAQRVEALADWCRGFLLGFGMTRGDAGRLSEDAAEVLEDFAHIAEAMPDAEDDEDSDRAFAELAEYARVGAQLVYEETTPPDGRARRRH